MGARGFWNDRPAPRGQEVCTGDHEWAVAHTSENLLVELGTLEEKAMGMKVHGR